MRRGLDESPASHERAVRSGSRQLQCPGVPSSASTILYQIGATRGIDRICAGFFRRGRYFRLFARFGEYAWTGCWLDDHLQGITDRDLSCLTEVAVDDDEEA